MSEQKTDDVFEEPQSSNSSPRQQFPDLNPDPKILDDLEAHARAISSNLDMALRDLRGALRGVTDLSLESSTVFNSVINESCDSVDTVIRSTYTMVAKTEELNVSIEGIQRLALQIKDMKTMIDRLESHFIEAPQT